MAYRLAKSLETLRAQINAAYPKRSKVSDGWIGDAAHASRSSDHNPWVKDGSMGVVTAFDITQDPKNGLDCADLVRPLLKDRRTKYIIFNRKIYNPTISNGAPRDYRGVNAHKQHLHISVSSAKVHYDSTGPWNIEATPDTVPFPGPVTETHPLLKKGSKGEDVRELQSRLNGQGANLSLDADFGPKTEAAVKAFQKAKGLVQDGVAGPKTWTALLVPGTPPTLATPDTVAKNVPLWAVSFFESLGWKRHVAVALVAHLMWESGGHTKGTINWDAKGDKDKHGVFKSRYAPQWNGPRITAYEAYADKVDKRYLDPETQLRYLNEEMKTSEEKVAKKLRETDTLDEAVIAALGFWRPSIPHTDQRLGIARALFNK